MPCLVQLPSAIVNTLNLHYTHPAVVNARLSFIIPIFSQSSTKILAGHSDVSYLIQTQACSRVGGNFFLFNNVKISPNNGAILNIAHIVKNVMSSATEDEITSLYITSDEAVYIIMHHPRGTRPPTTT